MIQSARIICLVAALATGGCATFRSDKPQPVNLQASTAGPAIPKQDESLLFLNVVNGLEDQQRYDAALAFLDDYALKRRPQTPRYWLLRGNALLGADRKGEAIEAYAQLTATALDADGWNGKGRVAASSRQWAVAQAAFQKAVQLLPTSADFLNNLAYAELQQGLDAQSAAHLRAAHELAPESALVRNNYVIALVRMGDLAGADRVIGTITSAAERGALLRRARDETSFKPAPQGRAS